MFLFGINFYIYFLIIMKDIKNSYNSVYEIAIENEDFVEAYFESYASIRG